MESDDFLATSPAADLERSMDPLRVQLWFYIAHRPGSALPISFRTLSVDGINVWPVEPSELPGKQGWQVSLGSYATGRSLQLKWEFDTLNTPASREVQVGVYRDSLRNRTLLAKLTVDSYGSYGGLDTVATQANNNAS